MPAKNNKKKNKKKDGAAATPAVRDCANCGASEGSVPGSPIHSACGRCLITFYCSPKCQKEHWKTGGHKQHCVKREDRGGSGGKDTPQTPFSHTP